MHPTSAKVLHRFVPESTKDQPQPPVFFLTVPTKRVRAVYDRELTTNGVQHYTRRVQIMHIREVIEGLVADNKADMLALVDRVEAIANRPAEQPVEGEQPVPTEAETAAARADALDLQDWRGLEMRLLQIDPTLRQMHAANRFYMQMAPQIAARVFIAGWEHRAAQFHRGADGLMDEDLVEGIDDDLLNEIWLEVLRLLRPSETDVKNSASPQQSPQDPATSPAASSPPMDQPGNSSESNTSATPASA